MWNQFDVVQIVDTNKVRYLSGPKNRAALPDGYWTIVGFMGMEVVLAKQGTIIVIPIIDVQRVASYNLQSLMDKIEKAGYQHSTIDIVALVSKELSLNIEESKQLLLQYNLPLHVDSESQKQQIIKILRRINE